MHKNALPLHSQLFGKTEAIIIENLQLEAGQHFHAVL
jgi:hypothetical protein